MTNVNPAPVENLNLADSIALASGLFDDGNYAEAERLFRAAEQAGAGFAAINGLGMCLSELERPSEALQWFDRAYVILRDEMMALGCNRAKALAEVGKAEEALLMYNGLLASSPRSDLIRYSRALIMLQMGQHEQAIAELNDVLSREPGNDKARFARGFARLVLGDYASGFEDYECRLKDDLAEPNVPLWTGSEDLHGKTILVHGEMGLGDNIMFMRFVPLMIAQGAMVIVVVPKSQRFLVDAIDGASYRTTDQATWPRLDYWVRFMSLARCFRTMVETVPNPIAVHHDPRKLERWRSIIDAPGLKVGLCWTGSLKSRYDAHRSIPLEKLSPLFDLPGVTFYGLQKDVRESDRATLAQSPIIDIADRLETFEDTANAMACLDLMITVDTSVAHMAGTVGVPTWIMLTAFRTYWLWIAKLATSPWYPSVRLFRQERDGDWPGLVRRISAELSRLSSEDHTRAQG